MWVAQILQPWWKCPVNHSGLQKTLLKREQLQIVGVCFRLFIMLFLSHWGMFPVLQPLIFSRALLTRKAADQSLENNLGEWKKSSRIPQTNKISLSLFFSLFYTHTHKCLIQNYKSHVCKSSVYIHSLLINRDSS